MFRFVFLSNKRCYVKSQKSKNGLRAEYKIVLSLVIKNLNFLKKHLLFSEIPCTCWWRRASRSSKIC